MITDRGSAPRRLAQLRLREHVACERRASFWFKEQWDSSPIGDQLPPANVLSAIFDEPAAQPWEPNPVWANMSFMNVVHVFGLMSNGIVRRSGISSHRRMRRQHYQTRPVAQTWEPNPVWANMSLMNVVRVFGLKSNGVVCRSGISSHRRMCCLRYSTSPLPNRGSPTPFGRTCRL